MLRPRALRSGDRVALVSPASPFDRNEFDAGAAELRRLGLEPVWSEDVFAREPMVSGAPDVRARDFLKALRDPSIAALIAVRGGYGSVEILPFVDAGELRDARKILCGYSDITSLLVHSVCNAGVVAFHGPMIDRRLSRGDAGYHAPSFEAALWRAEPMGVLAPEGVSVRRKGRAEGMLIGGTLTQLAAGLGTPYALALREPAILFIEDVAERPYRIRRMLMQLRLAGIFERVTAIVLGVMAGCDEPGGQFTACEVADAFFAEFPGPVLSNFPSGHGDAPTWTLPFGVRARVDTERLGPALAIEEPACSTSI